MTSFEGAAFQQALVVDDEPLVRQLTMRALAEEGFRCDAAADGAEALILIGETNYDLVVTDLRMPVAHGHGLAVSLLESDERPVLVVLTGILEPRIAKDLLARGVDDIVFKPVDYGLFALKASALVKRKRSALVGAGCGRGEPEAEAYGGAFVDGEAVLPRRAPQLAPQNERSASDRHKTRSHPNDAASERPAKHSPRREDENAAVREMRAVADLVRGAYEAGLEALRRRVRDLEEALAAVRSNRVWKSLGVAAGALVLIGAAFVLVLGLLTFKR